MIYKHNFVNEVIESILSITGIPGSQKISIHDYFLNTNANKYVKECINSGWVSSAGKWVDKFENIFVNIQVLNMPLQ